MKLNTYTPYKKPIVRLSLVIFAFGCQNNTCPLYQEISFDALFPITLYQNTLDESMALCGDLQCLQATTDQDRHANQNMLMDSTIGRIVRLISCFDELTAYQEKTNTHAQEDGAYLLTVFDQMHTIYQTVEHTKLYPALAPLFDQTRQKLSHAFEL